MVDTASIVLRGQRWHLGGFSLARESAVRWPRVCWTLALLCFCFHQQTDAGLPSSTQDMLKDLGAVEVTDEMIQKTLNEGYAKKARAAKKIEEKEKELKKGVVESLAEGGLDLTGKQQALLNESPDKVADAKQEAIAQGTQLAMYQQVRCEGCTVVAEVLGTDLQAAWKKGWKKDSVLSYVQSFCESKSLPGGWQITAMAKDELDPTDFIYVVEKFDGVVATTPHSLETLRRICKEQVDDLDVEVAKQAVKLTAVANSGEYSATHHEEIFQRGFNYTLCTTPCGGKKSKEKLKKINAGLKVEL